MSSFRNSRRRNQLLNRARGTMRRFDRKIRLKFLAEKAKIRC